MELLAGLLGLALFALIIRCRVLPYLIRLFTLSSGIVVYALMQALYIRSAIPEEVFKTLGSEERFGLMMIACILVGLLVRLIMFPFSSSDRLRLFHQLGTPLPSPSTHLLVWVAGSVMYRLFTAAPSPLSGHFALSRMDLPLLLYSSITMFAFVMWRLKKEYRAEPGILSEGEREKSATIQESAEERKLRGQIELLREEAARAERRWAATVLQERAARIHAERTAREFAEARKQHEAATAGSSPNSLREALNVLSLSADYDAVRAREAYHGLIRQYHPDKVSALGPQLREIAERETKRINTAYGIVVQELRKRRLTTESWKSQSA